MSSLARSLPNSHTDYLEDAGPQVLVAFPAQTNARVSVVIPTLNEAKNLPFVLPRVPAWVDEVLLVDGRSTDDTVEVARQLRPDIRIVYEKTRGKGAALRAGFAAATGDIIVMLDADGSTDPGEIPYFVGALLSGADYAKGTRFIQGGGTADMPLYRKMGNWSFVFTVRMLFGGRYSDLCYGYNAFWKRVIPRLSLDADGFEIETMMNVRALQAGLKIAEVPSFEAERIHGTSNLKTIPDGWRVVKTIVKEWLRPAVQQGMQATEQATDPMVSMHQSAIILNGKHHPVAEPVPIRTVGSLEQAQSESE
jgi:glycosyltransferase involved in cell wall biosynthesis